MLTLLLKVNPTVLDYYRFDIEPDRVVHRQEMALTSKDYNAHYVSLLIAVYFLESRQTTLHF